MKLAAIDIGSNAARLLITDVRINKKNQPEFIKSNLVRVPLRLGFDVFEFGAISSQKVQHVLDTMKAYRLLLNAYEVKHLKACATSAMRDATNGPEIIEAIKKETDIDIEIISGDQEAALIYENHFAENEGSDNSYLYIDVGGGSTEITCFTNGSLIFKRSFNIGTIRLLKQQVQDHQWEEMKDFIRTETRPFKKLTGIGSGGNINKVFSLSKRKEGRPLNLEMLRSYYKEFNSMSLSERMSNYKLREDRADVIVPALLIYINVLKWAGIEELIVPKIGLADGLIHSLYAEMNP